MSLEGSLQFERDQIEAGEERRLGIQKERLQVRKQKNLKNPRLKRWSLSAILHNNIQSVRSLEVSFRAFLPKMTSLNRNLQNLRRLHLRNRATKKAHHRVRSKVRNKADKKVTIRVLNIPDHYDKVEISLSRHLNQFPSIIARNS